jgi:hypothetical protein
VSEQHGGGPLSGSSTGGERGSSRLLMSMMKAGEMSEPRKERSGVVEVPRYGKGGPPLTSSSGCLVCKSAVSRDAAATVEARSSGSSRWLSRHITFVASCCAFRKVISARASASRCSVWASFSSRVATRSRCRARCLLWFSRTLFRVCSADTRPLRRGAASSDAWPHDVEVGEAVTDDMLGKLTG